MTRILLATLTVTLLGGCTTSVGFDWKGDFQTGAVQPDARPHTDVYRMGGQPLPDNGYGTNPGYCTSNGVVVWESN